MVWGIVALNGFWHDENDKILQNSLDQALFLYIFTLEVLLSGVRSSISIVHIRKFFKI